MNHIEHALRAVADIARGWPDVERARCFRVREERIRDEDTGEEWDTLVKDELGMGDKAVLSVDGENLPFLGRPRVSQMFARDLVREMPPEDVARILHSGVAEKLGELTGGRP